MAKVTRGGSVVWKGGGPPQHPYTTELPAGLRVKPADHGQYFLEDLSIFKPNSFELHDATYYGLRLNEDQVKEEDE